MIHAATTRIAEAALRLRAHLGGSAALRQRLALDALPGPATVWVHGASVGELTSARSVIVALAECVPLQITANSETGRDLAAGWGLPARLAPLDLPGALDRFLGAVRPRLLLTIESEFWPLRSRLLAQRGIAHAMIGARMSERSAATWAKLPRIIGPILGRIAALSAQDQASEARLLRLGLPAAALLPRLDLKLIDPARIAPPPHDPDRDATVLAASTHEGEDAPILDAFLRLRADHPGARLILAPRHPHRAETIAALVTARALPLRQRSRGADAAPRGGVLLADTLGEMALWYRAAGICLVGGSLVERGGHTPWEPAAHRCALLHGPHVENFRESFDHLDAHRAAQQIGADTLAATLSELLSRPQLIRSIGDRARAALDERAGDPAPLVAYLAGLASGGKAPDMKSM